MIITSKKKKMENKINPIIFAGLATHARKEFIENIDKKKKYLNLSIEKRKQLIDKLQEKLNNKLTYWYGIDLDVLRAKNKGARNQIYAFLRHAVCYIVRERYFVTYMDIGKLIARDHSCAIHSHKRVCELIQINDPLIKTYLEKIDTININE